MTTATAVKTPMKNEIKAERACPRCSIERRLGWLTIEVTARGEVYLVCFNCGYETSVLFARLRSDALDPKEER